jgi:prophage regulatory protein
MQEEILRKPRVLEIVGIGNTSLYDLLKRGEFPRPIRLGVRAVGWRRSDVNAWLASRETAGAPRA